MPAKYRQTLQHAHREIVGMLPEGKWISDASTLKKKVGRIRRKSTALCSTVEKAGHRSAGCAGQGDAVPAKNLPGAEW
ncbi:MAG: hypothetical protein ABIU63_01410 [Chitinophagaceae bacterium]